VCENLSMTNRLASETSPYLLQHKDNPVNWFPWSDEVFGLAIKENKPIMLSIGYSTCHWCHVMEHESFEDEGVAKVLNEYFYCIKVDREERPDLDSLYMNIAQILMQRGGWPLNVFMTPNKEVFYSATYIPKETRNYPNGKMMGMLEFIPYLGEIWRNKQDEVLRSSTSIMKHFQELNESKSDLDLQGKELTDLNKLELSENLFKELGNRFDSIHGGFGSAPKFPSPHNFLFLLNYYQRSQNKLALEMVELSLLKMRLGGVFDHIGYGFHRYSTDREWLLPHFEKMLYDQAMLMQAYARCYEVTKKDIYARVVEEIYEYLSRDMTSEDFLFYTAEDADSEGEEGLFYTWTCDELKKLLLSHEYEEFYANFNLEERGNFKDEASHEYTRRNIPYLKTLDKDLPKLRNKLYELRKVRVHPLKDDKVLLDWNALMSLALIQAYKSTEHSKYLELAKKNIDALIEKFIHHDLELVKSSRLGKLSHHKTSLTDYAFFISALLAMFEVDCSKKYIDLAQGLMNKAIDKFWDAKSKGFFNSSKYDSDLPLNIKETYDGAIPCANSVMTENLFRLSFYSNENDFLEYYKEQVNFMYANAKNYASSLSQFVSHVEESMREFQVYCKID
jgi:uncharacterized protein